MTQAFYGRLTTLGEQKDALAKAQAKPLVFAQMAVGDGGGIVPVPDQSRTKLINEKWRAPLNSLSRDQVNLSQVIAELIIPENIGGWYVRELGLYDADGDMVAIANCPETYKPLLAEGSGRVQTVRMVLIVTSADTVELKIDPAIVLATREYADQMAADKASEAVATHVDQDNPHSQYLTKTEGQRRIEEAIAALVDSSPDALNTLRELADALGDDPHFATTMLEELSEKAPLHGADDVQFAVADPTGSKHALNLGFADARYLKSSTIGELFDWPMDTDPGYGILCNGAALTSALYADLFAKLVKSASITFTLAAAGVVNWPSHGLSAGSPVKFTTTGTVPTGLVVGTTYYVIASSLTAGTFQLSATRGGTAIAFTGAQAGVHTGIHAPYGCANDLSTFNVPNIPVGYTTVQASGNEGVTTVGEVISHTHTLPYTFIVVGSGTGLGSSGAGTASPTTNPTGGSANLAAGMYVRKYIRFK